ncbi:MAG: anaerobic sulfatase maturase [Candidatus Nealsonbacteria bacterium]|nr:anaerobic sulfatase maturase [Candidatus Nealsonbacteria bacterium]
MPPPPWPQLGLHVIAKPIGPVCNLRCAYCFYLDKESLYGQGEDWRMSDRTLDAFVRQYIEAQPEAVDVIDFAFQGGEPTLLGIDFFRRVIELQKEHRPPDKQIQNALQTNGLLLDDRWCEFLRANNFLVGLSIDGPIDLHDKYRRDKQGRGTFERVAATMQRLSRHGVEFNALTCVNRHNGDHGRRVYRFLRDAGVQFMQFIPIVERLENAEPQAVSDRSVRPEQFGRFLIEVFDEWVGRDVGQVFVRDCDQALSAWVSAAGADLCVYAQHCGRAVAIEHNGDLYSCDHFVDLPHKLGNIHDTPIRELANSPEQEQFGRDKHQKLPNVCRRCPWLFICNGACPKDRFVAADGQPGLNYLCPGYKAFFKHIDPTMKAMAAEVQAGRPAAGVMHRLRAGRQQAREEAVATGPIRRNAPCPCGSGKKFKSCCMRGS